jgi:branched-chain amino acid transport system permease protein
MNVGIGGFMAIGGYTSAILVSRAGLNSWYALPIAGLMAVLIATPIGFLSLRMKGFIFAIFTLAINEIVMQIGINWTSLTGGPVGIAAPRPDHLTIPGLTTIEFASKAEFYYFIVAIAAICLLVAYRLTVSSIGRTSEAIRQDQDLAQSVGINTFKYKMVAFLFGCFFAGIAGAFVAHYRGVISPGQFGIWKSFYALVYIQVGGLGSLVGPAVGASVLSSMPEVFRFLKVYEPLIMGAVLMLSLRFLPKGFISLPEVASTHIDSLVARIKKKYMQPSNGS